jgi:hypothetical protein
MNVDLLNYQHSALENNLIYISSHYAETTWSLDHIRAYGPPFIAVSSLTALHEGIVILHSDDLDALKEANSTNLLDNLNINLVYPGADVLNTDLKKNILSMKENGHDWDELYKLMGMIEQEKKLDGLSRLAREKSLYVYQRANSYLTKRDIEKDALYQKFLENRKVTRDIKNKDLLDDLIGHFVSDDLFHFFKIIELSDFNDIQSTYSDALLVPLDWLGMTTFCCFAIKDKIDKACFVTTLILECFEHSLSLQGNEFAKHDISLWEETIESLPFPVTVVSKSGNIEIYNKKFTQLNLTPRECLALVGKDVVEISKSYFDLKIKSIETNGDGAYLFLFLNQNEIEDIALKQQSGQPTVSSEDLGIISSSIAHELNNPLAGILAAINVLELEEWDKDSLSIIQDMKNSAKRCKNLVEIFLSFTKNHDRSNFEISIEDVISQAIDLLRFRMIESNTRLVIDVKETKDQFQKNMSMSLSAMFFYMVLGEILTDFNRHQVVTGKKDTLIKGHLIESKNQIKIVFDHDIYVKDFIEESKLIRYLIGAQGFSLDIVDNGFSLNAWTLL